MGADQNGQMEIASLEIMTGRILPIYELNAILIRTQMYNGNI